MNKSNIFVRSLGELKNIRTLTMAALLAAVYAISYSPFAGNFILIPGVIEIRFGFLAIAVCAMLFGPVVAGISAVIGDFVGTILFYGGSFFMGYTISWLLMAIAFGLFFYKEKISTPRIVGAMLFKTLIINLLFTTYLESLMGFGTFEALFLKRIVHNVIMFPINTILLLGILKSVSSLYRRLRTAPAG